MLRTLLVGIAFVGSVGVALHVNGQGLGVNGNLISLSNGSTVLQVHAVLPGTLAYQLGIVPGDNIVSINNFPLGNAAVNEQAIAMVGGGLTIVVERRGHIFTLGRPGTIVPGFGSGGIFPGGTGGTGGIGVDFNVQRPGIDLQGPDLQVEIQISVINRQLYIRRVTPGGYGDVNGLRVGDVIESVNGFRVMTIADFMQAYVFRNGQIVLGIVRGSLPGRITLYQTAQVPLDRSLGLRTTANPDGTVAVRGSSPGIGREMGIAEHGTIIRRINGRIVRTRNDLDEIDRQLVAGRITQLVIEVIRPNGRADVVRYP